MKLNEFKQLKKAKINEVDLSSVLGNYGSAAARTGMNSLLGKSTLSTQDQIAKDQFVKSFMSKAAVGLQDAIRSGWVSQGGATQPAASGAQAQQSQQAQVAPQATSANPADAIAQKRIAAQKAQAAAIREPGADEGPKYAIDPNKQMAPFSKLPAKAAPTPAQTRQQKLATAANAAQGQMAPVSKLPADQFAKSAANVRKQQQGVATQNAQGQMAPVSKLPADQFAKTAATTRQNQQATATQNAQGGMAPVSKLPADQFAKTAGAVRQQQQGQAATAAQGQMTPKVAGPTPKTPEQIRQAKQAAATAALQGQMAGNTQPAQNTTPTQQQPTTKAPSELDKPWDPATGKGAKYDGVTGKPTPEYQKELDRQEAAYLEKIEANRVASQARAKDDDEAMARLNQRIAQQNMPNVTQTTNAPNVVTKDPAEVKAAMQAKLDAMKQKNPKLAAQMADLGIDDEFDNEFNKIGTDKPDNTIEMPKRNKKPKGKVAESRFEKLDYLFESIIAEAEAQSTKSISQWVIDFFKKFMKGEDIISDPTIMTRVTALANELEQTYAKDKGKTTIPKLADLAWSATHAPGDKAAPNQSAQQPTPQPASQPATAQATATTPQDTQASAQKAKSAYQQIQGLLKGLTPANKQKILASLQKELGTATSQTAPKKAPARTTKVGKTNPGLPSSDEQAKFDQLVQRKLAGK